MIITIKKPQIHIDRDWLLDLSFICYLNASSLMTLLAFLPIPAIWATEALIYTLFFAYCILKKEVPSLKAVLTVLISAVLFAGAYLAHPENQYFFTRDTYGIMRVFRPDRPIFAVLFISMYRDKPERLLQALWIGSLGIAAGGAVEFAQMLRRGFWMEYNYAGRFVSTSYSLFFGYKMMMPCLVFMYTWLKKRSALNAILMAVVLVMILIGGSRGQLICLGVYLCLLLLRSNLREFSIQKCLLLASVMAAGLAVLIIGPENISNGINQLLNKAGVSSRALTMTLSGQLADDNSRNAIWGRTLEVIKSGGFFGYGVYGDRPFIYPIHFAAFCHNIFLELMVSFGAVLGALLSLLLVGRSLYIVLKREENLWIDIFCIMLAVSAQLLVSMSFWYITAFWAAIEISHYCGKRERKRYVLE